MVTTFAIDGMDAVGIAALMITINSFLMVILLLLLSIRKLTLLLTLSVLEETMVAMITAVHTSISIMKKSY